MQVISGEANGNQMATLMSLGEEKQDLDLEGSVWLSQSRDFKESHEAGKWRCVVGNGSYCHGRGGVLRKVRVLGTL